MGVVSLLSLGNFQSAGIDRDLGDKPMVALLGPHRSTAQRFAVAHQLVEIKNPGVSLNC
jgi:hypothetical protein